MKLSDRIYQVGFTGEVKRLEILSITNLPKGKKCYEVANHGFKIFPSNGMIEVGTTTLCLGLKTLRSVVANKPKYVQHWIERLENYESSILELRSKLAEYEGGHLKRSEFIDTEQAELIQEKEQAIALIKEQNSTSV